MILLTLLLAVLTTAQQRPIPAIVSDMIDNFRDDFDVRDAQRADYRPLLANVVRLAFHSCVGEGGCDGCINLTQPDNAGLSLSVDYLEDKIPAWTAEGFSRSDLYALASMVAANMALGNNGWASDLSNFEFGRNDCEDPTDTSVVDAFPDAHQEPFTFFAENFGFSAADTVAILGAHTIGRALPGNSGFDGFWADDALNLDNGFFQAIERNPWRQNMIGANQQWLQNRQGPDLIALNADMALVRDFDVDAAGRATRIACRNNFQDCANAATLDVVEAFAGNGGTMLFAMRFRDVFVRMLREAGGNTEQELEVFCEVFECENLEQPVVDTPNGGFPGNRPNGGFPGNNPPNGGLPGNNPPNGGLPGNNPPNGGFPENNPPNGGFPENTPPNGGFPGNNPPNGGFPENNAPNGRSPNRGPDSSSSDEIVDDDDLLNSGQDSSEEFSFSDEEMQFGRGHHGHDGRGDFSDEEFSFSDEDLHFGRGHHGRGRGDFSDEDFAFSDDALHFGRGRGDSWEFSLGDLDLDDFMGQHNGRDSSDDNARGDGQISRDSSDSIDEIVETSPPMVVNDNNVIVLALPERGPPVPSPVVLAGADALAPEEAAQNAVLNNNAPFGSQNRPDQMQQPAEFTEELVDAQVEREDNAAPTNPPQGRLSRGGHGRGRRGGRGRRLSSHTNRVFGRGRDSFEEFAFSEDEFDFGRGRGGDSIDDEYAFSSGEDDYGREHRTRDLSLDDFGMRDFVGRHNGRASSRRGNGRSSRDSSVSSDEIAEETDVQEATTPTHERPSQGGRRGDRGRGRGRGLLRDADHMFRHGRDSFEDFSFNDEDFDLEHRHHGRGDFSDEELTFSDEEHMFGRWRGRGDSSEEDFTFSDDEFHFGRGRGRGDSREFSVGDFEFVGERHHGRFRNHGRGQHSRDSFDSPSDEVEQEIAIVLSLPEQDRALTPVTEDLVRAEAPETNSVFGLRNRPELMQRAAEFTDEGNVAVQIDQEDNISSANIRQGRPRGRGRRLLEKLN